MATLGCGGGEVEKVGVVGGDVLIKELPVIGEFG
jgi:hypothetical protein